MSESLLDQVIIGLPNFLGLVLCVLVLAKQNSEMQEKLTRLIEVIIRRENCDDTD